MATPLDGIISCKGFAYNICNKNTVGDNQFIRLGTISGVIGSHIKIECLLGNSNIQGSTEPDNILPTNVNAPILLTIYGSFHDNSTGPGCCNFEGYYTIVGNNTNTISAVYVELIGGSNYNYNVYIRVNSSSTNLNYFVYLPNNCIWENDGGSYPGFVLEDSRRYEYPKL
jgi:hypothetical protein